MIIKPVNHNSGQMNDDKFLFPVRVYYEDTDAGGVVYYANYLKFAERARTEFVRCLGVNQQEGLEAENAVAFMVRRCEADYQSPAVLDAELIVSCKVVDVSGASATIEQEIKRADKLLVSIKVVVVCVSLRTKRPIRMPKELKLV